MPMAPLFRLQNVSTKRRDRINSDEEERRRLGYEIITGLRFSERDGTPTLRTASVELDGVTLVDLHYGPAAMLWRINKGENRRRNRNELGFALDLERGYWGRSEQVVDDQDDADPLSGRVMRVIPYVEDHRNALLMTFHGRSDLGFMASMQAALKSAVQVQFQLEDSELAAEPLPSRDDRRLILLYESSEGGAGVPASPCRRSWDSGVRGPKSTRHLPFRSRDRGRSRASPQLPGGLRSGLLRLPDELRQPARPREA